MGAAMGAPPAPAPDASPAPAPADTPPTAAAGAAPAPDSAPVPTATAVALPFTTTSVDVIASADGGEIERMTGVYGPGFTGRRLIDGKGDPSWQAPAPVTYPQEAVFSFFNRDAALVSALVVVLPKDETHAPKDVEVWASTTDPDGGFTRVAAQALLAQAGEQTIEFPAVTAKYVKLRVLSGASDHGLEIGEVRVLEAARDGYVPLFTRDPEVKKWDGSPRQAGQFGIDYLQQSATAWPKEHKCFGCHVQSQAIMGQAIALRHDYRISLDALRALEASARQYQENDHSWFGDSTSATMFGVMGLTYADQALGASEDPGLIKGLDFMLAHQTPDGAFPVDRIDPPINKGNFMATGNTLVALDWAMAHTSDPRYKPAAERALNWIATNTPTEDTQDYVFKILALTRDGTPDQKRLVWPIVEQLATLQQKDGGWKERTQEEGSNAFATGQVLYAMKQAGVSVESRAFVRGVRYLLRTQVRDGSDKDGSWQEIHSQSGRQSPFAHTMWAVIGLAGSYGVSRTGSLEILTHPPADAPPSRDMEIVLDVSGSMNSALGTSTRWKTALAVLKDLLNALPDDYNVGLRVYGHRFPPRSRQSCSDSELVVPIQKLDRNRILSTANALHPRGETPLVRSVLQTVDDLHTAGSGSVILITDGQESCHGDSKAAAAKLKASGIRATLNIVGFTLTGKTVAAQLGALAGSTGGRYYSAQDGDQLSDALMLASMQQIPYEVFDTSGREVVSGKTSDLGIALPPGDYKVRVHIKDQELEKAVTIAANQTTSLMLGLEGDRFVFEP